eukprot:CAMPEP_0173309740 /NCGR_PEP_ID=MMETSP1143-20121109/22500_1 /TAXON_ID=483371 /ORGANISM="non described non described, Strain CCMP2298" /LENGTH=34 /DNA_ID= /DNA_START= /DNA_END= /DNA_ORIENTATION=
MSSGMSFLNLTLAPHMCAHSFISSLMVAELPGVN